MLCKCHIYPNWKFEPNELGVEITCGERCVHDIQFHIFPITCKRSRSKIQIKIDNSFLQAFWASPKSNTWIGCFDLLHLLRLLSFLVFGHYVNTSYWFSSQANFSSLDFVVFLKSRIEVKAFRKYSIFFSICEREKKQQNKQRKVSLLKRTMLDNVNRFPHSISFVKLLWLSSRSRYIQLFIKNIYGRGGKNSQKKFQLVVKFTVPSALSFFHSGHGNSVSFMIFYDRERLLLLFSKIFFGFRLVSVHNQLLMNSIFGSVIRYECRDLWKFGLKIKWAMNT